MKYAVVSMGDKQYIAREGESIEIDRQPKAVGDDITFDEVLLVVNDGDVQVGDPTLKGITVTGTVEAQIKGPKILVFKYIPKERYRRRRGHRQRYTRVKIDSIAGDGKKKAAAEEEPKAKSTRSKKTAAKPKAKSSPSSKSSAKKSTAKKPTTKKSSSTSKTTKKE